MRIIVGLVVRVEGFSGNTIFRLVSGSAVRYLEGEVTFSGRVRSDRLFLEFGFCDNWI